MTLFDKVQRLYIVHYDDIIDPNLHNAIVDCFKEAYDDLKKIRDNLASQGKDVSTLDKLLSDYYLMISKLKYVKIDDWVYSDYVNQWIDLCKKKKEIDKEILNLLGE